MLSSAEYGVAKENISFAGKLRRSDLDRVAGSCGGDSPQRSFAAGGRQGRVTRGQRNRLSLRPQAVVRKNAAPALAANVTAMVTTLATATPTRAAGFVQRSDRPSGASDASRRDTGLQIAQRKEGGIIRGEVCTGSGDWKKRCPTDDEEAAFRDRVFGR